ncbi:MAG: oligosaccharide flippase family protein [Patescibacteria group bacterium]
MATLSTFPTNTEDILATIKKRSFSGALSYFFRTIILQVIALVAMVILSAEFSARDFGIFGIVTQITGILIFFSDVGLAAALIQQKKEPSVRDLRTAFTVQQLLSWLIVLAAVAFATTGWFRETTSEVGVWIMYAFALSFPLATLKTIPSILLERQLQLSKVVIPQIFEQFFYYGILIVMAVQGYGAIAFAYAIVARSVVGVLVMFYIQRWPFGLALNSNSLKTLFGFGVKFQLNDLFARIKDQLFFIVIARFMTVDQFGYIQWAKQWSMQPYNLTVQNVMSVTFPAFSRLQEHKQQLTRAIEKTLFFISIVIFPLLAGMSIFILPLISIFPVYDKWLPAVASLVFFNLSIGWSALSTPLTNTLNAVGKVGKTLKLMLLWTGLTWTVSPVAVYFLGYNGVAIAAFIIGITSLLPMIYVKKIVPIRVFDQVWRQLAATAVMSAVGIFGMEIWGSSLTLFLIGVIMSGALYALTLFILGKQKLLFELRSLPIKIPLLRYD